MNKDSRILVTGSTGLIGKSLVSLLEAEGYENLFTMSSTNGINLLDENKTRAYFNSVEPTHVIHLAAVVGGISANDKYSATFILRNLQIQNNVIDAAYQCSAKKFLFMGSGCVYPRDCEQPIKEEYLLTGPLEKTNEAYAVAKIAGIKMCEAYKKQHGFNAFSVMPANVYGPYDNFSLTDGHVVPALIHKFYKAKTEGWGEVEIWGDGAAKREFIHVEDLARALVVLMQQDHGHSVVNVGSGHEVEICRLAGYINAVAGFGKRVSFDRSMPSGTPRKLLDSTKMHKMGWTPKKGLNEGLAETYAWFAKHYEEARK